jgi:hypothetical protein
MSTPQTRSEGPDAGASRRGTCNSEMKLGDTCDSCWQGIMMPPGGIQYYKNELAKYGYARVAHGQNKLLCPRCGHYHLSIGTYMKSGFDPITKS